MPHKSKLNPLDDDKDMVYVVFTTKDPSARSRYLKWRLKPKGHVFAIVKDYDKYIKVEYCYGQTFVWALTQKQVADILEDPTITDVMACPLPHVIRTKMSLRPYTCVELTKQILGIHHWYIFTPKQLHKYLSFLTTKGEK